VYNSTRVKQGKMVFNFSIFSSWNVNLVGELRRSQFKIPRSFQKHLEKNGLILVFGVTLKKITLDT